MLDDRLRIETPEQIDLAYDVAGLGARFVAALIDHVLMALILALIAAVFLSLVDRAGLAPSLGAGLFGIGAYFLVCAYYIFFETVWNGQTPGKRLTGLRVVRVGGRPIGFLGSTTRNIIRLVDFLPILYGLGMLVMFVDRSSRRLGDMAAGAMTVKEQRSLTLETLLTPVLLGNGGPIADQLTIPNLHVIAEDDYRLIQEYLGSRMALSIETRRRLSGKLLTGLQQRLGYPVYGDAEAFLLRLVAEYHALHREPAPIAAR